MTPATMLTMLRLAAAPLFVVFLLRETPGSLWVAAGLYVFASLTDAVDGYLARKTGTVTPLGRMLDPIADKVLVAVAFLSFLLLDLPGVKRWMVAVIVGREVLVTTLRSFAGRRGVIIHSSPLGKWKTFFQMGFVVLLLALMSLRATRDPSPVYWQALGNPDVVRALGWLLLLTTLITLASGLDYLWRNRAVLRRMPPEEGAA